MDLPGSFITCPTFANSGTRIQPDGTHTANGFAVNEYLPAEYFNWLEWAVTANLNQIITNTMTELDGVLTQAGVSPVSGTNTQFASCFTTSATAYKYVQRDLNGNSQFSSLSMTTTGVGIKRTVATDPLEVSGVISIWNGSTKGLYGYTTLFGDAVLGNASNYNLIFSRNNLEKARIDTNDYLLLGYTTSQGAYKLQVNGTGYFANSLDSYGSITSYSGGNGYTNLTATETGGYFIGFVNNTISIVGAVGDAIPGNVPTYPLVFSRYSGGWAEVGHVDTSANWTLGGNLIVSGTGNNSFAGNVGIRRTPTTYAFEVAGDIYATGTLRGSGGNVVLTSNRAGTWTTGSVSNSSYTIPAGTYYVTVTGDGTNYNNIYINDSTGTGHTVATSISGNAAVGVLVFSSGNGDVYVTGYGTWMLLKIA